MACKTRVAQTNKSLPPVPSRSLPCCTCTDVCTHSLRTPFVRSASSENSPSLFDGGSSFCNSNWQRQVLFLAFFAFAGSVPSLHRRLQFSSPFSQLRLCHARRLGSSLLARCAHTISALFLKRIVPPFLCSNALIADPHSFLYLFFFSSLKATVSHMSSRCACLVRRLPPAM